MVEMVMWMNKRRLLMILLILAIAVMVLYPLLYPKTLLYLYTERPDGTAMGYRVNVRGRVTVLWEKGEAMGSYGVRLSDETMARLTDIADHWSQLTEGQPGQEQVMLEIREAVVRDDWNGVDGPGVDSIMELLVPYLREEATLGQG